jgi:hypothetical protein
MAWQRRLASAPLIGELGPLLLALGALAVSLATAACGSPPERAVINRFFDAARLHDLTLLRSIATANFPPHTHGIVLRYEIIQVSDERRIELPPAAFGGSEVAQLSLDLLVNPAHDGGVVDGALYEEEVLIEANVEPPNGAAETQHLALTLQRAVSNGVTGRWIVTALERRAR